MIDLYSKPRCVQCTATLRAFASRGLVAGRDFTEHDLSAPANAEALEWIMGDLGYREAPVVVVSDEHHWSGFRPDLIAGLHPSHD